MTDIDIRAPGKVREARAFLVLTLEPKRPGDPLVASRLAVYSEAWPTTMGLHIAQVVLASAVGPDYAYASEKLSAWAMETLPDALRKLYLSEKRPKKARSR